MPIVHIDLLAGRDPETVKHCLKEVALTLHRTLGAPLATIRVVAHELPAPHWAVGEHTRDEIDALQQRTT